MCGGGRCRGAARHPLDRDQPHARREPPVLPAGAARGLPARRHGPGRRVRAERSVPRRHPRQRHPRLPSGVRRPARHVLRGHAHPRRRRGRRGGCGPRGVGHRHLRRGPRAATRPPRARGRSATRRAADHRPQQPHSRQGDRRHPGARGRHQCARPTDRGAADALRRGDGGPGGGRGDGRVGTADARVARGTAAGAILRLVRDRHGWRRGPHLHRGGERHPPRRRHDRHRPRRHVGTGSWRDQLVGVADPLGRHVRGALLRRPHHPDERGMFPPAAGRAPARDAGEPRSSGGLRRPPRHRGRRHRSAAPGARRPPSPTWPSRRAHSCTSWPCTAPDRAARCG